MTKDNLAAFDQFASRLIQEKINKHLECIKSAFSCCSKETNENGDGEMKDVDDKSKSFEDLSENVLEEKTEATPTKSSTQVSTPSNQKKDSNCCFGASSFLTFFDNVRAIFSQGRSTAENSKYSRILVIVN